MFQFTFAATKSQMVESELFLKNELVGWIFHFKLFFRGKYFQEAFEAINSHYAAGVFQEVSCSSDRHDSSQRGEGKSAKSDIYVRVRSEAVRHLKLKVTTVV